MREESRCDSMYRAFGAVASIFGGILFGIQRAGTCSPDLGVRKAIKKGFALQSGKPFRFVGVFCAHLLAVCILFVVLMVYL